MCSQLTLLIGCISKSSLYGITQCVPGNEVGEEGDQQEDNAQYTAQVGVAAKTRLRRGSWCKILSEREGGGGVVITSQAWFLHLLQAT